MTAKEFVKSRMPKARAERHVNERQEVYWLIRDYRQVMYFASVKIKIYVYRFNTWHRRHAIYK